MTEMGLEQIYLRISVLREKSTPQYPPTHRPITTFNDIDPKSALNALVANVR
jgi:hypothetical protein